MGIIQELQFRLKAGTFDRIVSNVRAEGVKAGQALGQGVQAGLGTATGDKVAQNIVSGLRTRLAQSATAIQADILRGVPAAETQAAGERAGRGYVEGLRSQLAQAQREGKVTAQQVATALREGLDPANLIPQRAIGTALGNAIAQGAKQAEEGGAKLGQEIVAGLQSTLAAQAGKVQLALNQGGMKDEEARQAGVRQGQAYVTGLHDQLAQAQAQGRLTSEQVAEALKQGLDPKRFVPQNVGSAISAAIVQGARDAQVSGAKVGDAIIAGLKAELQAKATNLQTAITGGMGRGEARSLGVEAGREYVEGLRSQLSTAVAQGRMTAEQMGAALKAGLDPSKIVPRNAGQAIVSSITAGIKQAERTITSEGATLAANLINGMRANLNRDLAAIRDELNRGFKDERGAFQAGVQTGQAYNDGLKQELQKAVDQGRLTQAEMQRALSLGSVSTQKTGQLAAQGFLGGLESEFNARRADIQFRLSSNLISPAQAEKEGAKLAQEFDASVRRHITQLRSTGQLSDAQFVKLTQSFKTLGDAATGARGPLENFRSSFTGLGTIVPRVTGMLATFGVVLSASAIKQWLVSTNVEYGNLLTQLETTEGSTSRALTAFRRMEAFAIATPFTIGQATEAFIRLRAQGITPTAHEMMVLSDFASAKAKSIDELVMAATQAALGQTFRLKAFHVQTKIIGDEISLTYGNMTQKVRRNAEDVYKALLRIGEANFAGASERQMNRLGGRLSNLQDAVETLARRIGDAGFNDAFGGLVTSATEAITAINDMEKEIKAFVSFMGAIVQTVAQPIRAVWDIASFTVKGIALLIAGAFRLIEQAGLIAIQTTRRVSEFVAGAPIPALRKLEDEAKASLARQDAALKAFMADMEKDSEGFEKAGEKFGAAWKRAATDIAAADVQLTDAQKKERAGFNDQLKALGKLQDEKTRDLDITSKRASAVRALQAAEVQLAAIYNSTNATLKQREEAMRMITEIEQRLHPEFVTKLERPEIEKKTPDQRRGDEIGQLAQLAKLHKTTQEDLNRITVLEAQINALLATGNLSRERRATLEGQLNDLHEIQKDSLDALTQKEDKALESFLKASDALGDRTAALPDLIALERQLTARIDASNLANRDRNSLTEAELALLERRKKVRDEIEARGPISDARISALQTELQFDETRKRAAEELKGIEQLITDEIVTRGLLTRTLNDQERADLDKLLAKRNQIHDIFTRPLAQAFADREQLADKEARSFTTRAHALNEMLKLEKDITAEIARRAGLRGQAPETDEDRAMKERLDGLRDKIKELKAEINMDEGILPLGPIQIFGDSAVEQAQRIQDAFQTVFTNLRGEALTLGNITRELLKQGAVQGLTWLAGFAGKKALQNLAWAQEETALGTASLANPFMAPFAAGHFAAAAQHYRAAIMWGALGGLAAAGATAAGMAGGGRTGGAGGGASSPSGSTTAEDATKGPVTIYVEGGELLDTTNERQMDQFAKALGYVDGREYIIRRAG